MEDITETKVDEQPEKSAYRIIAASILTLTLVVIPIILVVTSQCSEKKVIRENTEHYRNEVQTIVGKLSASEPQQYSDLQLIKERLEQLEVTMQGEKLDYAETNISVAKEAVMNHDTIKEVGSVTLEWSTDKEISRDTKKTIEKFKSFSGNSLHYIYLPKNGIESKAIALYNKYYWPKNECMTVAQHKVFIGMTKQQLIASWGRPSSVNRTTTAWSNSEQWVYGSFGPFVYLEDGVVTAVQN